MYSIMGYSNLAREEANGMAKKSGRTLVLACVLFVFVCLLLSGGWRLIGSSAQEENTPVRPAASIRAVLSSPAAYRMETGIAQRRDQSAQCGI